MTGMTDTLEFVINWLELIEIWAFVWPIWTFQLPVCLKCRFVNLFKILSSIITSLMIKKDYDQRLKSIQKKMTLYRKMKSSFESTNFPGKVTNMSVESYGPTSLLVSFDEPAENGGAMIFEYMSKQRVIFFIWSIKMSFLSHSSRMELIEQLWSRSRTSASDVCGRPEKRVHITKPGDKQSLLCASLVC